MQAEIIGGRFPADGEQLASLCRQIFGAGSGWRPYRSEVFIEYGRSSPASAQQPEPSWAFVCVRILVVRSGSNGEERRTVVTHCFVDNESALGRARQIFGFPALLSTIDAASGSITVSLVGDANTPTPFLTLTHGRGAAGKLTRDDLLEEQRASTNDGRFPFIQLKQMRDALDPARACYQDFVQGVAVADAEASVEARDLTVTFVPQLRPQGFGALLDSMDLGLSELSRSELGYHARKAVIDFWVERPTPERGVVRSGRDGKPLRLRRGDPQAAPAYSFSDVAIVGFRVPVARNKLVEVCERLLGKPLHDHGYRYSPANVDLVIECLDYPKMTSENPPLGLENTTATSQRELTFRMLVVRKDADGRRAGAPAVFCPFVFVDSPWSLISGREVMGYPKDLASFETRGSRGQFEACRIGDSPSRPNALPFMHIDCRYRRDPPSVVELFEQSATFSATAPTALGRRARIDFAWWGLADLQSGGADADAVIAPWLAGQDFGYRGVQLKRFVRPTLPEDDCYRELVECQYTLLRAEVALPTHNASLYFSGERGQALAEAFGLPLIVPVPPGSWYRTTADFRLSIVDPLA